MIPHCSILRWKKMEVRETLENIQFLISELEDQIQELDEIIQKYYEKL